jgi:arsenate reductase (thioredoxin)
MELPKLLILCSGNSCCRQIAERFWTELADYLLIAQSAGMNPAKEVHLAGRRDAF